MKEEIEQMCSVCTCAIKVDPSKLPRMTIAFCFDRFVVSSYVGSEHPKGHTPVHFGRFFWWRLMKEIKNQYNLRKTNQI